MIDKIKHQMDHGNVWIMSQEIVDHLGITMSLDNFFAVKKIQSCRIVVLWYGGMYTFNDSIECVK